ncbi:MAG: DNA N-6-adenine-methyltransferase [Candidatus Binataceae bacterium]
MLERATRVDEAKSIRDKATALRAYAASAKDHEMEILASELRMRSERRAGEILITAKASGDVRLRGGDQRRSRSSETTLSLPTLADLGISRDESSKWQRIARLPVREFEAKITRLRERSGKMGTRGFIDQAFSSESDEYLTPPEILEATVKLLGEIDLDPCAEAHGPKANVPAGKHFTPTDDGLVQPWDGRIFMNPPYGGAVPAWVEHLVGAWKGGTMTEAVALLAARTDTGWFAMLESAPVCFIRGRLRFRPSLQPAPFPSAIFYLGDRRKKFAEAFVKFGPIYKSVTGNES